MTFEGVYSKSQTPQLLFKEMGLESVAEKSKCSAPSVDAFIKRPTWRTELG